MLCSTVLWGALCNLGECVLVGIRMILVDMKSQCLLVKLVKSVAGLIIFPTTPLNIIDMTVMTSAAYLTNTNNGLSL